MTPLHHSPGPEPAMAAFEIRPLAAAPDILEQLADIMVATVAAGGSVNFMHPMARADALAFWTRALAAAERGERVVLGAWDGEVLAATVSLVLDLPPNQPHRAEIAKLMTRPDYRGRGAASELLTSAEILARDHGRWLLTLDTAVEGGATDFYRRHGYQLAGTIPDYALTPHGELSGASFFWKDVRG